MTTPKLGTPPFAVHQGRDVKPTYLPNKVEGMRTDSDRLRELISQCAGLNTYDVSLLAHKAPEVWSYARSLALEIGVEFRNGPVPKICTKVGGDCGCGGNC